MRFFLATLLILSTGTTAAERPLLWEQTLKEFMVLREQLRYAEAERLLLGWLTVESRPDGRTALYLWLATVRFETGRVESAEGDYMRLLSELRAVHGERSALLLRPLLGLASLHMETNRVELAERDFAQASSLEPSQSTEDRLTLLHTGAMVLDARGKLSQAENEYRRVAALTGSTLGPAHQTLGPIPEQSGNRPDVTQAVRRSLADSDQRCRDSGAGAGPGSNPLSYEHCHCLPRNA